jgi:hypothetical protein
MSLNMIVGYCGLLSLAQAGYFAVGSYVYALAALKLGLGFLPALILAIGVAALLSLALSLPAWRFKGDSFVMVSLHKSRHQLPGNVGVVDRIAVSDQGRAHRFHPLTFPIAGIFRLQPQQNIVQQ